MTALAPDVVEEIARAIGKAAAYEHADAWYGVVDAIAPILTRLIAEAEARATKAETERAAKVALSYATCGCNGSQGLCNTDDAPKAIAAAIQQGRE